MQSVQVISHTCWGLLVKNENEALLCRRMFTEGARNHHMEPGVAERFPTSIMERLCVAGVGCGAGGWWLAGNKWFKAVSREAEEKCRCSTKRMQSRSCRCGSVQYVGMSQQELGVCESLRDSRFFTPVTDNVVRCIEVWDHF